MVWLQAQQEKALEAQQMERALAQYIASIKDKEEQQRCKARQLKDDRERQVWRVSSHPGAQ